MTITKKYQQIIFLTGTRADYGKIKPLLKILKGDPNYEVKIVVTGMHLLAKYGSTVFEIEKDALAEIILLPNQINEQAMEISLSKTIEALSMFFDQNRCDLFVIHGDRVEALAGAVVGSIRNIPVAHIEGGEVSGTIDGMLRHSISKLSHIHFVANQSAEERLIQLGELKQNIYVIGSPDIDAMLDTNMPEFTEVQRKYTIPFEKYGILIFHPVTTEITNIREQIRNLVRATKLSGFNFVVIKPNNDNGSQVIQDELAELDDHAKYIHLPSMRFEYFLRLMKSADFMLGNSSAGVREAPYFGIPTINIGTRQRNRVRNPMVIDVNYEEDSIRKAIDQSVTLERVKTQEFGSGNSAVKFKEILDTKKFWSINTDKVFIDT